MASAFVDFSNGIADAVEHAGRSVVAIREGGRHGVSGTVWSSGVIVTAEHTIRGRQDVTVKLPSGEIVTASVAVSLVLGTLEALMAERGAEGKIWGSMVKQALKRRHPGFNESYYGYKAFSDLLEDAEKRNLIKLEPDEKSGGYVIRPA